MENQSDSNYSSVFSTQNTDHCRVDGECNMRSAVGSAVLSETERWRAAILSWVQLGDLPALETEVSGWTELAGWRCLNFTNNPGNMRRALEEEETAAYHVLLASFIRSLFVPRKSPFVCAVQKLEILVDSQRELHKKVDRLLQEASGSSVAAARQADAQTGATEGAQVVARRADTQNGATEGAQVVARRADTHNGAAEGAQVAALRNYSANGAGEGAQGAGLPKYRQHGANHGAKAKPAATEARTRRSVRASAHCAADAGAVAVVDTPSSCEASPGPTKQRDKRGGKQVRQQQAAKTLLALLEDMSQPKWDNGQGAAKQRLRGR